MKIRSERDKRTYLIIALCAILVVMGVGYAAFSSLLTINGTANISNSWCVGFDNTMTSTMQVTKGVSTGTQPTGSMSYSGTTCGSTLQPNSSLAAHFYQPGDEIEYTLTITNKSTVVAAIKSILVDNESVTSNTTKKKGNITYVVEMPAKTTLDVNESTTMKVIAKFQNETDVTGNVNGETKTIEVKINAEQDDGNGGFTPMPTTFSGTIYRNNTNLLFDGLTMNGEATVWYPSTEGYASAEEALADYYTYSSKENCEDAEGENNCTFGTVTLFAGSYVEDASLLGKTYYLKHTVVNDIITASYVCFVYNNAEYCMKGGDGGASFAANTQIIKDFQTFNSLPDNANPGCDFDSSYSYCGGGGMGQVDADSDGNVRVDGSSSEYCRVRDGGYSYCRELWTPGVPGSSS